MRRAPTRAAVRRRRRSGRVTRRDRSPRGMRAVSAAPVVIALRDESVGIIELARPDKFNCLSFAVHEGLGHALTEFERAGSGVRSILLRAQGKQFCTGADLEEVRELRQQRGAARRLHDARPCGAAPLRGEHAAGRRGLPGPVPRRRPRADAGLRRRLRGARCALRRSACAVRPRARLGRQPAPAAPGRPAARARPVLFGALDRCRDRAAVGSRQPRGRAGSAGLGGAGVLQGDRRHAAAAASRR